jgi:hypothetical protein
MRTYEDTFSGRKIYPGRVSAFRRPTTRFGVAHWEDRGGICKALGEWKEGHTGMMSLEDARYHSIERGGPASKTDPCPGAYFETWMGHRSHMLSTRADIHITGQALRPLGQQDLPLPVRQVRVAFPSAQEPP